MAEDDSDGKGDDSEIDLMKLSRWKKPDGSQKKKEKVLTQEEIDAMKGLSAEEQLRRLGNVFNFYAMDD